MFLLLFILLPLSLSLFRMPSLQNNNLKPMEVTLESFPTTNETTHSETNTPEPLVEEKTYSGACDFSDTSVASEMNRAKPQDVGSTPSKRVVKSASDGKHTAASQAKTPPSAAGNKAKTVTVKDKIFIQSTEVETSNDRSPQREYSNDKTNSMLPTLKDQSTSGPSSGTGSKSKIPKRSTSGVEVKSAVTPDKTAVTDATGTVAKLQKQPRTKESVKSHGRLAGLEEAKGGQALSRDISPTKTAHKVEKKLIKEKSEDANSINIVNGLVKSHEDGRAKTAHPTEGESLDVGKEGQKHLDSKASLATSSRLPVSFLTRKLNNEISETSDTNCKDMTSSETNTDRPKTARKQSPEQQAVTPGRRPGNETPPSLPKSPKKGKVLVSVLYCTVSTASKIVHVFKNRLMFDVWKLFVFVLRLSKQ